MSMLERQDSDQGLFILEQQATGVYHRGAEDTEETQSLECLTLCACSALSVVNLVISRYALEARNAGFVIRLRSTV